MRNTTPHQLSRFLLAASLICSPVLAYADVQQVPVNGKRDCSGILSAKCGWGDLGTDPGDGGTDSGGGDNGYAGGASENTGSLPTPSPKKKAAIDACVKTRDDATTTANLMYTASMGVCAAKNSSWYGYLHQEWLKLSILFGGSGDCETNVNKAYGDALDAFALRLADCIKNAN